MHQGHSSFEMEQRRLQALYSYDILDSEAEPRYDDITELAARCFQTPIALLSLVDRDRLWFKSKIGIDVSEIPRDMEFCDAAILNREVMVVEDASLDERFCDSPLVAGPPFIKFYAGAPLLTPDGHALGTLSIIDLVPRRLDARDRATLAILARQAVAQLELQKQTANVIDALSQLGDRNRELALHNRTLEMLNLSVGLMPVLQDLVEQVESLHPRMICSVLMLEADGKTLRHGVSSRLPDFYVNQLDGLQIGDGVGSCGSAAFRGERVVTEDVTLDPGWAPAVELAKRANIRSCWSQPIKDGEGKVLGTFAIYHDQPCRPSQAEITMIERYANLAAVAIEQKRFIERVHQLAFYDPLTELPNRRLVEDRLAQAVAASARSNHHGALLFIDLDHFKTINDTLGHAKGDMLLRQVAERLISCVRKEDSVARLGGDEFVVMLINLSETEREAIDQVEIVSTKILGALNQPYHLNDDFSNCTPSIGITLFQGPGADVDDLLKQADMAMYRSKAAGRNAIHFFNPTMEVKILERARLEADLRYALARQQMRLLYQAQVIESGRLVGAEVLMRWDHPQRGLISPLVFIPVAEETGLIVALGRWALEKACTQLALWAERPVMAELTIAVNISAHQIKQPDFVEMVLAILAQTGAPPNRLKLELTESLLIDNIQDIIAKMAALKEGGVRFSLDDFGTGYSSLAYLKLLPLEQLKIDQSFVRDVLDDSNDATIAKAIVALAQSLGFDVIAEGVETKDQRDFLASSGCYSYQGFYFSEPLPLDQFEQYCFDQRHCA